MTDTNNLPSKIEFVMLDCRVMYGVLVTKENLREVGSLKDTIISNPVFCRRFYSNVKLMQIDSIRNVASGKYNDPRFIDLKVMIVLMYGNSQKILLMDAHRQMLVDGIVYRPNQKILKLLKHDLKYEICEEVDRKLLDNR